VISLGEQKDLCFVFKPPESLAMNDPVPVLLKDGPYGAKRLLKRPSPTGITEGCIRA